MRNGLTAIMDNGNILEVVGLKKYFPVGGEFVKKGTGYVKAVDGVSFSVGAGETLGLVGESGCGKSTLGRLVLRLIEKTDGKVLFKGEDIYGLRKEQLKDFRRKMQVVFQDPYGSLNPKMTIGSMFREILRFHNIVSKNELRDKIGEVLSNVGVSPFNIDKYPHEFSGGQLQRIAIARAISLEPEFIVADEPVSALDVSVQAQIINLLGDLKEELNLTFIFISHNLSIIRHISDTVAVMYLGRFVEKSDCEELFERPAHPYTEALLSVVPVLDTNGDSEKIILEGDIPDPADTPSGCYFHPRCKYAFVKCERDVPELKEIAEGHFVCCHLNNGCGLG